jgi:actin-related protein 5
MTITSVQSLLPGRIASNAAEKQTEKPPPQLHGITDFPFQGYHPPQPEGYQQSQAHPDTSAIVIDNGKELATLCWSFLLIGMLLTQAPILSRPVGHSTKTPDLPYLPS